MQPAGSRQRPHKRARTTWSVARGVAIAVSVVSFATPVPARAAPNVCGDVVSEDGIKASDALAVLKSAVGIEQDLHCPSSVAGVLSFDAVWSPATVPGNNGNTLLRPEVCRTTEHVGRENEIALIAVSATMTPSNASTDVLYIEPLVSKDGGPFNVVLLSVAAESAVDGTAHASTVIAVPLEVGIEYRFGAGFGSNSGYDVSTGTCQGTVQIVRPEL
jgi:hypothetical protein